jgi:hypothetical protein
MEMGGNDFVGVADEHNSDKNVRRETGLHAYKKDIAEWR